MDSHEQGKPNRKERRLPLQRPDPSESGQDIPMQTPYGGTSQNSATRVIAGGLFALFCALVIAALAVFGVINMLLGHLLMFLAAVVGTLIICTEIIPSRPPRHKVISTLILCLLLGVGDAAIVKSKYSGVEVPQPIQPEPQVTVTGYVGSLAPYAEGTKFAGITWHPNEVDVRADIATGSTDIENLDFTIQMDTEIVGIGQATKIPGCTMFPAGAVVAMGATILDSKTRKPVAIPLSREMALAPTYRVQCPSVFANTVISFSIASVAVNPGPPKAGKQVWPWQTPKSLSIKGTYETREGGAFVTNPLEYSINFKSY